jgi:heavy metal translocating P-type ATPase
MSFSHLTRARVVTLSKIFGVPLLVLFGLMFYFPLTYSLHQPALAQVLLLIVIGVGSFELLRDTVQSLLKGVFALDYIALLAITTGVITHQYLVATVIVLMLSGGNALEYYGDVLARRSLVALVNRIPQTVQVLSAQNQSQAIPIHQVEVGQIVQVRKGEVIPLDGELLSPQAQVDESSITGEPYPEDKLKGDRLRSGTVNAGNSLTFCVTKADQDSSYRQIIKIVEAAQAEKSPLIRLADQYSTIFTIITIVIASVAYLLSHDIHRILAVLVIATPCPLILATPIALMGGMNQAAKKRIVVKNLGSLEVLAKVKAIILDKTGTITLGVPKVTSVEMIDKEFDKKTALQVAAGIERHSLHPLAKTIVKYVQHQGLVAATVSDVHEEVGKGILATWSGNDHAPQHFSLTKAESQDLAVALKKGKAVIAVFHFSDEPKPNSLKILAALQQKGIQLHLFTGDIAIRAQDLVKKLGIPVTLKAECSPEEKRAGIVALKKQGIVTAMVGDGINDAPALATADVGLAFSHEEQTAASEAADVVLLGNNFELVTESIQISQRTLRIAQESILFGIGCSIIGMLFAAAGYIPPVIGAFIQEAIDVTVILNALRASRD